MTAGRYRTPMRVPAVGGVLSFQETPATGGYAQNWTHPSSDLFGGMLKTEHTPHPDFEARAAIWRDQAAGLISLAEAQRRSAAVGVVSDAGKYPRQGHLISPVSGSSKARPRHTRPAPNDSRQYASGLATTVMRDDRITPNAKAFLAVLRARCGKGRVTAFAKATMAAVMSRAPRTIARYLRDLERFGYITTEIRRTGCGFHTGLVVTITEKVAPFFEEARGLAAWLAEAPAAVFKPFRPIRGVLSPWKQGVTMPTSKNQSFRKDSLSETEKRHRESIGRRARPPF